MTLDRIALTVVIILALTWLVVFIAGMVAMFPFGLPVLLLIAVGGYLLIKVIKERMNNKEDDYYERNIKE